MTEVTPNLPHLGNFCKYCFMGTLLQLNFYLSAVDGLLKKEQDHPSIGLLLCKSKNDLVAEYSLKDMSKPIGVSAYRITSCLPEEFEKQLPSVEDLQKRIL